MPVGIVITLGLRSLVTMKTRLLMLGVGLMFAMFFCLTGACGGDTFTRERTLMVNDQIKARGIKDERVIRAMEQVPRHEFVPEDHRAYAYEDGPLPIGYGQTISQPYIVALMSEMLGINANSKVLEVGTGSGYQAAILAEMVSNVYTIEIIKPLADAAAAVLKKLGYDKKVTVKFGDGYHGWPEHAPFDAIIVTAVADHVPPPLIKQLKNGGRMAIPLGSPFGQQWLVLVKKDSEGKLTTENVCPVAFVPLTRAEKKD
jgi:protein-L-isoaspartate(D-aspartate) O-methyltransferase